MHFTHRQLFVSGLEFMWTVLKAFFVASIYWLLSRLWFFKHIDRPIVAGAGIYAHWHGDELCLVGEYAYKRMAILSSRSRDGELMTRVLTYLGFKVARGSSTRGGAGGLKGLIDVVKKEGYNASLAVDGPRGPIYKVKPGILKLAQITGRPLIPGAAAARRRFVFRNAWNKCYLPLPFTRCVIVYGKPIWVPQEISDEQLEEIRSTLESTLLHLKSTAEASFDRKFQNGV
jgi:lysophospholipid acyltransferase (LPLAT)-like uncharacterized protein